MPFSWEVSIETPTKKERLHNSPSDKPRECIVAIAEELVCPITQELPVDPVIASDGRVYDRKAVEDWIASRQSKGEPLKSPINNMPMETTLLPAPQVRTMIRHLMQSGVTLGSNADTLKRQIELDEYYVKLRRTAAEGNVSAMVYLVRHLRLNRG